MKSQSPFNVQNAKAGRKLASAYRKQFRPQAKTSINQSPATALRNLYDAIEELCESENVSNGRVQGAMATARRTLASCEACGIGVYSWRCALPKGHTGDHDYREVQADE